jgi:hypothetical protein
VADLDGVIQVKGLAAPALGLLVIGMITPGGCGFFRFKLD